jgi:hypothetical protein
MNFAGEKVGPCVRAFSKVSNVTEAILKFIRCMICEANVIFEM